MYFILAVVCSFLVVAPVATAGDLAIRLTGKWIKMNQEFHSKSSTPGEYSEKKRDARIRYELRAEGFLAAFNQDKELSDNRVLGVGATGTSEGFLTEDAGKYYWRLVRSWKDKAGTEFKVDKKWEVNFTAGDWVGFGKGEEVELSLTAEAHKDWNAFHTELVTKFAEDLRVSYAKQFPKVTVHPVTVEDTTHKASVRIRGNADKLVIEGADSTLLAKVLVTL